MDIEQLTKAQIILLTLLVSFITSIATGIVTVSLLEQAPPAVTQTVNRVVERTIERVVPDDSQTAQVITKEVTTVVKEEDLITESIDDNRRRVVRLIDAAAPETVLGLGVVISPEGLVVTDRALLVEGITVQAVTFDDQTFEVGIVENAGTYPTALLSIVGGENAQTFDPATLVGVDTAKLGQSVIALSGRERTNVGIGILQSLVEGAPDENGEQQIMYLATNIAPATIVPGSPLLNIFGEVIGIATGESVAAGASFYTPISRLTGQLGEHITVHGDGVADEAE